MRELKGFSMMKFGIAVTAFFVLLGILTLASAQQGVAKNTIRSKCVYSDSSTMIDTKTSTAIGGSRMA